MTTPLEKTIKRALTIKGQEYVIALSPDTLKLTLKGHRRGVELKWTDLASGEAALATALQASVGKFTEVAAISSAKVKPVAPATIKGPRRKARK